MQKGQQSKAKEIAKFLLRPKLWLAIILINTPVIIALFFSANVLFDNHPLTKIHIKEQQLIGEGTLKEADIVSFYGSANLYNKRDNVLHMQYVSFDCVMDIFLEADSFNSENKVFFVRKVDYFLRDNLTSKNNKAKKDIIETSKYCKKVMADKYK